MNKTSPVFMHLFLTNPPVHPRETNRTREGECWGRWRGHSPWAALPPGCRCARSNPLADFFPFQPAQTRRSYFCAKVATKQSSPRANAGGVGLLREWTGVCLQSKLIRFTNRCSTRPPGCCRRMFSGQERRCRWAFPQSPPAHWALLKFKSFS